MVAAGLRSGLSLAEIREMPVNSLANLLEAARPKPVPEKRGEEVREATQEDIKRLLM